MKLADVNEAINELQNSDFSLSNVRNLSALLNVREHLQNVTQSKPDSLEAELSDILPQYKNYCDIKRQYQMHKLSDDEVVSAMRQVCKEVKEFLLILYQNTDTKIERTMIKNMVSDVQEAI